LKIVGFVERPNIVDFCRLTLLTPESYHSRLRRPYRSSKVPLGF
jgi:hypothetical protein